MTLNEIIEDSTHKTVSQRQTPKGRARKTDRRETLFSAANANDSKIIVSTSTSFA
jgi:hypothetical protein